MLGILITKELKSILLSPKFIATFAVCTVVLLLSVGIGIQEYFESKAQYESSLKLFDQQTRESTSYSQLKARVHRVPDPMQVFVSGLTWDIGRWSDPSTEAVSRLHQSPYSDDPIFAIFRMIDFAFVVQIVFSLFAVLFTFDAISGERELGTLKLVFSHAVPRARYLIAKAAGSWLGLVLPMTIAVLVAVLMVLLAGVPMTPANWAQLGLLLGVSLLYFTFFIVLGVCVSALTRQSSVSFLVALVFWVVFVLIIPRAGAMAAAQLVHVPSVAEIDGRKEAYAKDRWQKYTEDMMAGFSNHAAKQSDDEMWTRMEHQDSLRKATEKDIDDHESQLYGDLQRRKESQERVALTISRLSPSSSYQLAAMTLAGTGLSLKERYEDAIDVYRGEVTKYKEEKSPNDGDAGRLMITVDSDKGMKISQGRSAGAIDVSDMPHFQSPPLALGVAVKDVVVDFGLLSLYTLAAFALAFVKFTRYDVR